MSSNNSGSSNDEAQLLQDASTLLMFANVAAKQQLNNQTGAAPPPEQREDPQQEQNKPPSKTVSPPSQLQKSEIPPPNFQQLTQTFISNHKRSLSHPAFSNINSPGPASATLAEESANHNRNSMKAMIAAAALAEAADIPFPIPARHQASANSDDSENNYSTDDNNNIQDSLRPSLQSSKSLEIIDLGNRVPEKNDNGNSLKIVPKIEEISSETELNASEETITFERKTIGFIADKESNEISTQEHGDEQVKNLEDEINKSLETVQQEVDIPIPKNTIKDEVHSTGRSDDSSPRQKELSSTTNDTQKLEEMKEMDVSSPQIVPMQLSEYQVDSDSGVIGCICDISDDDGFTIQCDRCFRWQHSLCMNINSIDEAPDYYLCYLCDPEMGNKIDKESVTSALLDRLNPKRRKSGSHNGSPSSFRENQNGSRNGGSPNFGKDGSPGAGDKRSNDSQGNNERLLNHKRKKVKRDPDDENELLLSAESYQAVYYSLKQNDFKNLQVKNILLDLGKQFYNQYNDHSMDSLIEIVGLNKFKTLELNQVTHSKSQKKKNTSTIQVKPYVENPKQKFNGISKLGLFTSVSIAEGKPIIEYLGEVDFHSSYVNDPINQYRLWGSTKPKVLKTSLNLKVSKVDSIDVVVDSRFVGNESRFIRKACPANANCTIKQVYIPQSNSFKFLVVATKNITKDSELKLPWDWDTNHPILKMYPPESLKFDQFPENEKTLLIASIDNILNFVECGCSSGSNSGECALAKVRKASAHLLRSTRKTGPNKTKDEFMNLNSGTHVPWAERLEQRDKLIEMNLIVSKQKLLTNDIKLVDDSISMINHNSSNSDEVIPLPTNQGNPTDSEISTRTNFPMPSIPMQLPYKYQLLKHFQKITTEIASAKQPIQLVTSPSNKLDEIQSLEKIEEYLPIPIPIIPQAPSFNTANSRSVSASNLLNDSTNSSTGPPGGKVKKLSFADYKKKLK